MGEGELEVLGGELLDVVSLDVVSLSELNNLEDVDIPETRAVAGSHIVVKGSNSVSTGELTVLLVHVVGAGTRVVLDPDAEVLHLSGVLLEDLVDANDLTVGLLDTAERVEEVPETRLGNNRVGRKNAHTVELRLRLRLARKVTTNNLVLADVTHGV